MNAKSTLQPVILGLLLFAFVLAVAGLLVTSVNILLLFFAGILFGVICSSRRLHDFTQLLILLPRVGSFYLGAESPTANLNRLHRPGDSARRLSPRDRL